MPRPHALQPGETAIQAAIIEHWSTLGRPDTLVAAIPNARAAGQPGLTRGLPDLLVFGGLVGVGFIELKRDTGVASPEQLLIRSLCDRVGVPCSIAYGRDEPITLLEQWGVVRPRIGGGAR